MLANSLKCCLFVREDLADLGPGFFDAPEIYGMRSDLYMYKALKIFLKTKEITLETQHVFLPEESDVIICLNETTFFSTYKKTARNKLLVLILSEPPVYNKADWEEGRHQPFDKVFTYNADLVKKDPHKYLHFIYPIDLTIKKPTSVLSEKAFLKKKHSCMIAGAFAITKNKAYPHSLLYARYKVLKWYNAHAPGQLDYYARTGPEQKFLHFHGASLLNRVAPFLTPLIARYNYKRNLSQIYKGAVPALEKQETLGAYKFNFCFENSSGLKGYITEKLFDCFLSNTVPIYYGAPDIDTYVPKGCYLLFEDFSSMQQLEDYLAQMDYNTYIQYLERSTGFLNSPAMQAFSVNTFIETLYKGIRL